MFDKDYVNPAVRELNPHGETKLWSKEDLMEFGNPSEGFQFKLHGKYWEIIDMMSFSHSGMCRIQELM